MDAPFHGGSNDIINHIFSWQCPCLPRNLIFCRKNRPLSSQQFIAGVAFPGVRNNQQD